MTRDVLGVPGMVGQHALTLALFEQIAAAAPTELPVFVHGESGTGKELVASALHRLSPRAQGPFVALNCAAIAESLAEGELFGAERGAYTGAQRRTEGFLESAHGGTLILDEVCSAPLALQAKLLRALDLGQFWRVGGRRLLVVDVRLVATGLRGPESLVAEGLMREDFSYRLTAHTIAVPPLRERRSDVPLLAHAFLRDPMRPGRPTSGPREFAADALDLLQRHHWPGNVRELRWLVERLARRVREPVIQFEHVLAELRLSSRHHHDHEDLAEAVRRAGSQRAAARQLGIPLTTLRRRLGGTRSNLP